MRRIKLIIAYDGTNYCGWQIQPNGITVEAVLNQKLTQLLGEAILVIGASRTDSGVHALGNVAVFDTNHRMDGTRIAHALNTRLPDDIRIIESYEVPLDFHPRYCDTLKTYEYKIYNHSVSNPMVRLYSLFYYLKLDLEKMKKAADYLVGEHDFKSFCNARSDVIDTVRTVTDIKIEKVGHMITITITGNGFLYNMVRIIVGTLLKVGRGAYPPEYILEILAAKNRSMAGPTARPEGLSLLNIKYLHESFQKE
ncbi:MAG TPA: tRNA pseudouridine(38-40) synthase TruA [Candidatus Merdenecus merdavium]|nr:tRNA pseudouridine(38-40) synthase TruA [Candidatus Merdenecus merdavium]